MIKNCSTCKHSPVDEHCKGCKGEKDGNTHWEPEPFINKPCISECVRHEKMTNKEAIEYNKNLRMYMKLSDKNQPCKFLEENYIALDMAIKALEQQHCEDCIDRNLVLSTVKSGRIRVIDGEDWKRVMDNAIEIRELPPVQPKSEDSKFLEFLWNTINPNEMEQYLAMYHAKEEKVNE